MKQYVKIISDGLIIAISTNCKYGIEITKEEYDSIASIISSKPADTPSYLYKLFTYDMTYHRVKRPEEVEEDD